MTSLQETARRISRGPSLQNTPLTSPLSSAKMPGRTRQCHGCHGPCDDSHRGYPTGADRCTLAHDDRCEGGIAEGFDRLDHKWRGCPIGYVSIEDDFSDDDFQENTVSTNTGVLGASSLVNGLAGISLTYRKVATNEIPPDVVTSTSTVSTSSVSSMLTTSSNPSTATSTSVTASGLGSTMFTGVGETVLDQVSAARQRLLALRQQREGLEALAELQREEELEAAETRRLQDQLNLNQKPARPRVGEAASRLRARNQPSDQNTDNYGFYNGLTLPGIRKVPGLAPVVETKIEQIRTEVPSLSRRPDASLGCLRKQPSGVPLGGPRRQLGSKARSVSSARQQNQNVFDNVGFQPSFVQDLIVIDDADPRSTHQPVQPTVNRVDLLTEDPETDPSDEEEVGKQMKLVYRRDQNGFKYRAWEAVEIKHHQVVYEWVTDERTGRQYKQPVHGQGSSQSRSAVTHHPRKHERTPTFVSLSNSEKEGKIEKKSTIIDWARKCPVLWAEKVNFDSMNAIVWLWGYLSEILAEKSSTEGPMEAGVLDAKLQHALCVLEVCASHSEKTDFDTHGWRVAKLYAHKVQAQLERGLVDWLDFAEFKANPHPSELIAAKHELEQKLRVKKKTGEELRQRGGDRPLCTTWNSSKVEGRCDWQVRNPDKGRCNRRHDCSYCTEKGHGSTNHQRSFCARRIAAGDS